MFMVDENHNADKPSRRLAIECVYFVARIPNFITVTINSIVMVKDGSINIG